VNTSCQTDSRGTFAGCVNSTRDYGTAKLQQLGLCTAWIAKQNDINVTANAMFSINVLGATTEQCKR